jgi:hypothetical protein
MINLCFIRVGDPLITKSDNINNFFPKNIIKNLT